MVYVDRFIGKIQMTQITKCPVITLNIDYNFFFVLLDLNSIIVHLTGPLNDHLPVSYFL